METIADRLRQIEFEPTFMKPAEKIILNLMTHPRLTASQLARVVYPNRKTHMKAGRIYSNSQSSVQRVLKELEKKKVIKRKHYDRNHPDLWMFKSVEMIKDGKYEHEVAKGELYAAFAGRLDKSNWLTEVEMGGIKADCTMWHNGVPVCF